MKTKQRTFEKIITDMVMLGIIANRTHLSLIISENIIKRFMSDHKELFTSSKEIYSKSTLFGQPLYIVKELGVLEMMPEEMAETYVKEILPQKNSLLQSTFL